MRAHLEDTSTSSARAQGDLQDEATRATLARERIESLKMRAPLTVVVAVPVVSKTYGEMSCRVMHHAATSHYTPYYSRYALIEDAQNALP